MSDNTRDEVAAVLEGHRIDGMSQDSGRQCVCGSDNRFEQRGGDHPWASLGAHLADVALASPAFTRLLDKARAEAWDEGCEHDVATCRDGCAYNPYRPTEVTP